MTLVEPDVDLKLSDEVRWYLDTREIPYPTCPPKWKTPEGGTLAGAQFDDKAVDRVVFGVLPKLMHTQGRWAGRPLRPDPWQIAYVLAPVYGWKHYNEEADRLVRVVRTEYVDIPRKNGKAVTLVTQIPTPSGYTTMGELQVGDEVFAADGSVTRVTFVSETQMREVHVVAFADGSEVEACADHQWTVNDRMHEVRVDGVRTRPQRTRTTKELLDTLTCGARADRRYTVDVAGALQCEDADLPLDSWLLGYWLGNGSRRSGQFAVGGWRGECDREHVESHLVRAGRAWTVGRSARPMNTRISVVGLRADLDRLGVLEDKHVPSQYLFASIEQRRALLAGLLDSDGTASSTAKHPMVEYSSSDKRLAHDALFLIRSLGYKATIKERTTASGRTGYRIGFAAYRDDSPFTLARKSAGLPDRPEKSPRSATNAIVSIRPTGVIAPMRCIQVDHSTHTYLVGEGLVPTHNTTLAGAQAIILLAADGEGGAQVFAAAAGKDQARYCFNPVKAIAEKSPALKKRLKTSVNRITKIGDESFFAVVSSFADLLHGANVHGAIIDELHIHKSRDLVDALETGTGARDQPLIIIITTADDGRSDTIYAEKRKYCEQLARGVIVDPAFYGVVWGAEDEDDAMAEETWIKSNPGYGISPTRAFLRAEAKKAENSPANLARFKRLHCGIRTKQTTAFIALQDWDRNASLVPEQTLKGKPCYGGLDLASTSDLCALAWIFPDLEGGHDALWRLWMPEAKLHQLDERTAGSATVWADNGYLTLTPGSVTDYDYIKAQIKRDADFFKVLGLGYDPWNSSQLVIDLENEGMPMVQTRQGYGTLSSPTKELLRLVLEGTADKPRFRHGGNPALRWQIDNFAVAMDPAGNVKPDKSAAGDKIDGVVAAIMALDRAMRHLPPRRSVYEDRSLDMA